MSYTNRGDGVFTCDVCGNEMEYRENGDNDTVVCMNEGCKEEGRHHCVWVSDSVRKDQIADDKIHSC